MLPGVTKYGVSGKFFVGCHSAAILGCFEYRALDAVIVTNKYYQIWEALRQLMGEKIVNASRERVFDSRIDVLSSYSSINKPSNITELEKCLKFAFDKCLPKLQK
ncbi:MAG: hypothetical protein JW870_15815 [Candidatus Delongbacteria bacterium]|nr:hypothetical protein [Candidatus Delongbacteria bacterium]